MLSIGRSSQLLLHFHVEPVEHGRTHTDRSSISSHSLEPSRAMSENGGCKRSRQSRGGRGEPGGTRAMGVCEPGQGGNAAAINNTLMCLGVPPRLTLAPRGEAATAQQRKV